MGGIKNLIIAGILSLPLAWGYAYSSRATPPAQDTLETVLDKISLDRIKEVGGKPCNEGVDREYLRKLALYKFHAQWALQNPCDINQFREKNVDADPIGAIFSILDGDGKQVFGRDDALKIYFSQASVKESITRAIEIASYYRSSREKWKDEGDQKSLSDLVARIDIPMEYIGQMRAIKNGKGQNSFGSLDIIKLFDEKIIPPYAGAVVDLADAAEVPYPTGREGFFNNPILRDRVIEYHKAGISKKTLELSASSWRGNPQFTYGKKPDALIVFPKWDPQRIFTSASLLGVIEEYTRSHNVRFIVAETEDQVISALSYRNRYREIVIAGEGFLGEKDSEYQLILGNFFPPWEIKRDKRLENYSIRPNKKFLGALLRHAGANINLIACNSSYITRVGLQLPNVKPDKTDRTSNQKYTTIVSSDGYLHLKGLKIKPSNPSGTIFLGTTMPEMRSQIPVKYIDRIPTG